jgi:hypothetical protein
MITVLGVVAILAIFGLGRANMVIVGHKWRQKTETVAATTLQTIDFSTLMPEHEVGAFTFIVTGANNSFGGSAVDKYLSKLGTGTFLDMQAAEVRTLLEFVDARFGGIEPATNALKWALPFYLMNILIGDLSVGGVMPEVGLPPGTMKIWQTFLNAANSSAGGITIGWVKSARTVTHIPYFQGYAITGLATSKADQVYKLPWQPLPTSGLVLAWGATVFTRVRLYNPDENGVVQEVFDVQHDNVDALMLPYETEDLVDPIYIHFGRTQTIRPGAYFMLDTGAGYTDGAHRCVPIQFIPVNAGIPGLPNAGQK